MKAVLPGKPEARLQAIATAYWDSTRIIAYISGNAFSILSEPTLLLQTVYDDDETPLRAIAVHGASGKIATCTDSVVRIYKPFGQHDDALQWALQSSFAIQGRGPANSSCDSLSLSWGGSEELLVGHLFLELYETASSPRCIWRKRLANAVKSSALSYDSAYIASVGHLDRLVKVWRRLTFGTNDVRFDFSYLPHAQPVTSFQWRRPHQVDQAIDNVLYTICAQGQLRVWTSSDHHHHHPHPHLWGDVDLVGAIQDGSGAAESTNGATSRWTFMLHARDVAAATKQAVPQECSDHVMAVANRSPEVCVVMDGRGTMSAWGLEILRSKSQKPSVFKIAHVKCRDFDMSAGSAQHVEVHSYCNADGRVHVLLHFFDGKIEVYESHIARLLDPKPRIDRLILRSIWSGHSAAIREIVRNLSGRAIVSRTEQGQSIVWRHIGGEKHTTISRQAVIEHDGQIDRMCLLRKGRFVVVLHQQRITVWDCRRSAPSCLATTKYDLPGKPLCLLLLPRKKLQDGTVAHLATIGSDKHGVVWEIKLPDYMSSKMASNSQQEPSIREFVRFALSDADDLGHVLPVDPAGSTSLVTGSLDVFARDVAISYTCAGRVEFWTARVDQERCQVEWLLTSSTQTGIAHPALVSGSSLRKAALVSSDERVLTIWDIRGAQLEYRQEYEDQRTIQDLDWTSTPDQQSVLAVGFSDRVVLLSQMRFDYLNKGPAWATIRDIGIRDLTPHPIGDSTWLGNGHLVIGAGNQLFVHDRQFDLSSALVASLGLPRNKQSTWDLFDVARRLNGPLPVFHPQFLMQCMLAGKLGLVQRILLALHQTLKFWVEGDDVDDYLGMDVEDLYTSGHESPSSRSVRGDIGPYLSRLMSRDDKDGDEPFREEVAADISERLTRVGLAQLSGHEQIQLLDIVECVGLLETQRRSLDANGARFMLFFRQHALRKRRTREIHLSWREINWACHSTSQDILVDFATRQHHGSLLWKDARENGLFSWLSDSGAVRAQFETIARNEYTNSENKDPVACSLFYLALKKKTVLQGLWRMASWNREQAATQKFLANNFDDPACKTKALKNAYALMSKRRFEYAAAFFLLADHLQDAVNVCLSQLRDLQLAIALARVYDGDDGPVLRRLLEQEVLKVAAHEGNRWLASWAFWMLRRRDMAVRALIDPVHMLLETRCLPDPKSHLFLTDDPALVILYSQLRQKTLQTLWGAAKVTPKMEWDFVLHNARLYDRMGCDLLGLDLVRNWDFFRFSTSATLGLGAEMDMPTLLKRSSSLVVADMVMAPTSARMPTDMKSGRTRPDQQQQAAPAVFEEPDANSLLDSFGV